MNAKITALDKKITIQMFLEGMADRFQGILARQLEPREKLDLIIAAMEKDVQEKRVLARQIGAQKRAMMDPDTAALEPMEAAQARRAKLVKLGGENLGNPAALGPIQHEIQGLDAMISSQQATYGILEESYALGLSNYKTALAALENARNNGPAILKAIEAHNDALEMRDEARDQKSIDASFMDDLAAELAATQAEMRSDQELDDDLNADHVYSVDAALAAMDAETVDEGLMAEFRAAAGVAEEEAVAAATGIDPTSGGRSFRVTVEDEPAS